MCKCRCLWICCRSPAAALALLKRRRSHDFRLTPSTQVTRPWTPDCKQSKQGCRIDKVEIRQTEKPFFVFLLFPDFKIVFTGIFSISKFSPKLRMLPRLSKIAWAFEFSPFFAFWQKFRQSGNADCNLLSCRALGKFTVHL